MRTKITLLLTVVALMLGGIFAFASPAAVAAPQEKVTLCHKPGTEDEAEISVSGNALDAHLAHGDWEGLCVVDIIIDADGIDSAFVGTTVEVYRGATLSTFPTWDSTGLDMFDNNANGLFDPGIDDLHSEDPFTCPGAIRDGYHQLGIDCKVIDFDSSLFDGQQVNCDLEMMMDFTGFGCPANVLYYDTNANGIYDTREDLILDVNANGVYD